MMIRSRTPRIVAGMVLALALGTGLAGCAQPGGQQQQQNAADNGAGNGAGNGQLGDAGQTPDPTPTSTPSPSPAATGGPIVVPIDPTLLLPWPSPGDCINHTPGNLTILYTASGPLWQIMDGSHALMAFKRSSDATAALALAKGYKTHCFIGRGNTRTNRADYIMDYWINPVTPASPVPSPDCLPHTASALTIENLGAQGYRIDNGSEYVELFDTLADANNAMLVFKHYNQHCYIGRGNPGGRAYIVTWFTTL